MTLVKGDGSILAQAPGGTVLQAQADADPKVKVLINVYEDTPYDGVNYPTQMHQLKFRAGQIISQKTWDAAFVDPTVTAIAPTGGAAAGGTAVTITGANFTPGATVTIGGNAITSLVVVSDKKITGVSAAHTAGATDVVVTTAAGSATKVGAFTYA